MTRKHPEWPPYCYEDGNRIRCRPYIKGVGRMPPVTLGQIGARTSEVWEAYETKVQGLRVQTIGWLINKYLRSPEAKAIKSFAEIERALQRFAQRETASGGMLGDYHLSKLTPGKLRQYSDQMRDSGSPVMGNRTIEALSAAWNWAKARDIVVLDNPCATRGIKNKETARTRLVTDAEFNAAVVMAKSRYRATNYLPLAMTLVRYCGMRRGEALAANRDQVLPEGFLVRRSKGSKPTIVEWTPDFRAVVDAMLALDDGCARTGPRCPSTKT